MPLYRIGKVWYLDIATARGRIRRSAKTQDYREAKAVYQRVRTEIWRQEQLGESPKVTWGEAVAKWMETEPSLENRYRLRRLEIPLQQQLPISTERMVESGRGLSAGSWNKLVALITRIHKLSGITAPTLERKPDPPGRTRYLSKKEWRRLQTVLLAENPLLEQAARFTLATGLRENNVLNLEWSQVNLKRRTILFHADQVKNRATLGIPLNDDAMRVLRERKGKDKRWVFANPDTGKPLFRASNRSWYAILRKAKLVGFRFHDLRHTWASWAVQNGVSLRDLMELGGWKTYSMVIRYSHLAKEHLAEAANKVKPV